MERVYTYVPPVEFLELIKTVRFEGNVAGGKIFLCMINYRLLIYNNKCFTLSLEEEGQHHIVINVERVI